MTTGAAPQSFVILGGADNGQMNGSRKLDVPLSLPLHESQAFLRHEWRLKALFLLPAELARDAVFRGPRFFARIVHDSGDGGGGGGGGSSKRLLGKVQYKPAALASLSDALQDELQAVLAEAGLSAALAASVQVLSFHSRSLKLHGLYLQPSKGTSGAVYYCESGAAATTVASAATQKTPATATSSGCFVTATQNLYCLKRGFAPVVHVF